MASALPRAPRPSAFARLRRAAEADHGQVVFLMPFLLFAFVAFAAATVDVGMVMVERRQTQSAVDFAALAAAQDLPTSSRDPQTQTRLTAAEAVARDYLRRNRLDPAAPGSTVQIEAGYSGDVTQIRVSASHLRRWFFAGALGVPPATIGASAVAKQAAEQRDVVVVLDRSGSMCAYTHGSSGFCPPLTPRRPRWEPFDTMRDAAKDFTDYFEPRVFAQEFDHIALVTYSDTAILNLGLTADFGQSGTAFGNAVDAMSPNGRTNIGHALYLARGELQRGHAPLQVIVLLTDGMANVRNIGTDEAPRHSNCGNITNCVAADDYARRQARLAARAGAAIYTIGLTDSAGDALLREIADIGATEGRGGQYFDVADPARLDETFKQVAELVTVALIR